MRSVCDEPPFAVGPSEPSLSVGLGARHATDYVSALGEQVGEVTLDGIRSKLREHLLQVRKSLGEAERELAFGASAIGFEATIRAAVEGGQGRKDLEWEASRSFVVDVRTTVQILGDLLERFASRSPFQDLLREADDEPSTRAGVKGQIRRTRLSKIQEILLLTVTAPEHLSTPYSRSREGNSINHFTPREVTEILLRAKLVKKFEAGLLLGRVKSLASTLDGRTDRRVWPRWWWADEDAADLWRREWSKPHVTGRKIIPAPPRPLKRGR